jgi:hypothetical protein
MLSIRAVVHSWFWAIIICSPSLGITLGASDAIKWQPPQPSIRDGVYGYQVAYSQGTVLVGETGYDNGHVGINGVYQIGTNYGAAYAYSIDAHGNRTATAALERSDGQALDNFGSSVAIDGNLAIVGARWASTGADGAGAAWLFGRDTHGFWNELAHLTSSSPHYHGWFSNGVSVSGRTVAVGAPNEGTGGYTYIFGENTTGQWTEQAKIAPPTADPQMGFGTSVALFGDTLVVGAIQGDATDALDGKRGAAYVYRHQANDWNLVATLGPADPDASNFGASASLWKDTLVVGATHGGLNYTNAGSVYVFHEDTSGNWTPVTRLTLADDNDEFGSSVAVRDGAILVGAPQRNLNVPNRVSQGAAYLYQEAGSGNWVRVTDLTPLNDSVSFNLFGASVALTDGLSIIGAPKIGPYGSVYVYPTPIPEPGLCCHAASIMLLILLVQPRRQFGRSNIRQSPQILRSQNGARNRFFIC